MNQWARAMLVILGVLFFAGTGPAQLTSPVDTYTSEFEKSPQVDFYLQDKFKEAATVRQEKFRKRVSIRDAVGDNVPLALSKSLAASSPAVVVPPQSDASRIVRPGILVVVALFVTALLLLQKLAPRFFNAMLRRVNPWRLEERSAADLSGNVRTEDEAFGEFLASFQAGPEQAAGSVVTDEASEFHSKIERLLTLQRALLQNISRSVDAAARHRLLADLGRELQTLKGEVSAPSFLPAWQLASAVEGLFKQLLAKAGNVTPSTLRTVASAVDLLEKLCQPGVNPYILNDPPVKFLVVDDDMISRTAVALALKKSFNQPELAENGAMALGLARRHAYDLIFLDVQMPEMDGFELCLKIHETAANRDTPVVFVTCMSDFDAYAQATLSGGSDLMAKPFLTFEITVKALTLVLGRRLQGRATGAADLSDPVAASVLDEASWDAAATATEPPTDCAASSQSFGSGGNQVEPRPEPALAVAEDLIFPSELLPEELAGSFLARASAQLGQVQESFQAVFQTADEAVWQELLVDVYLCIHALNPHQNFATAHPAIQMSVALQGLLQKLLKDPKQVTPSTLVTVATSVDLLQDLCVSGIKPDLITNPPIRMLVVEDDPLARRALVGALQMAFEKPEAAASGEAALVLAAERAFDIIFLDVQMPGLDGFATCTKLRETGRNRTTPVVFVTGQTDFNARSQMSRSGGSDFVGKPFLKSEITVKALTFALRGRLNRIETVAGGEVQGNPLIASATGS